MATVPISGTNIRFLSDIPFSNDYKNTRWFDTVSEQTNYFMNKPVVHSMAETTFQRIEGQRFINTDQHIDDLWGTNYLMFQNAQYNNKWFYAFVTKLEYVNKRLTKVHFQIDVFQTWKFQMDFKPSYVLREHRPLWDGTKPIVNTLDEGLNYGTDYQTVFVNQIKPYGNVHFLVIVAKETMHLETASIVGNLNGMPQGLSYYIAPFMMPDGMPPTIKIGTGEIVAAEAIDVLRALYTDEKAVNNIVSIYITDFFGENLSYSSSENTITFPAEAYEPATLDNLIGSFIRVNSIPQYDAITIDLGSKYTGLGLPNESKLLMSPYSLITLDDLKGNRINIKPEYINGDNLKITIRGSLGTGNKVSYSVSDYNVNSVSEINRELAANMEYSVINNNPNEVPILNDYLASYLQGNRNSLENQKSQIVFNGIMNTASAGISGIAASPNALGVASAATQGVQGMGSAYYQLEALNAKKSDVSNVPATLAKMGSNSNFDFGYQLTGLFIIVKQIKPEYQKTLSHFFNMFGYKTNEIKIPNFHTRQKWNYVQTASCNITGNFNNEDLQELKSIFDNGITFWHTDDVGNYSLDNGVI